MPTNIWRGDAQAVEKIDLLTFSGTMTPADWYEVEINKKVCRLTIAATVTTLVQAAGELATVLTAFDVPEFKEVLWTHDELGANNDSVTCTSADASVPFTIQFVRKSPGATGNLTIVPVQAGSGPFHGKTAANWTLGTPVAGQILEWPKDAGPMRYDMDFSAISFQELRIYSSVVGLPDKSDGENGYNEYRDRYLKVGSANVVRIGSGGENDPAPEVIRVHVVADSGTHFINNNGGGVVVDSSGPPVRLTSANTGTGHKVSNIAGSLGLAYRSDETIKVSELINGTYDRIEDSIGANDESASTEFGTEAIITLITNNSGTVIGRRSVSTVYAKTGSVTTFLLGTPNEAVVSEGGILAIQSGGTIGNAALSTNAVLDLTGSSEAITATAISAKSGSAIRDPHKRLKAGGTTNITMDRSSLEVSDIGDAFVISLVS